MRTGNDIEIHENGKIMIMELKDTNSVNRTHGRNKYKL